MKFVAWKTVQSREGRSDEFLFSFGKKPINEKYPPSFLFYLHEKQAREVFGDEIDKITGINVVHPINLTLSMRGEE